MLGCGLEWTVTNRLGKYVVTSSMRAACGRDILIHSDFEYLS